MQLNKIDGTIIRIVGQNGNIVFIEKYENGLVGTSYTDGAVYISPDFEATPPLPTKSLSENILLRNYEAVVSQPEYSDYEICEDSKNWLMQEKVVRVLFPNDVVVNSMLANNQLGQLIASVYSEYGNQTFQGVTSSVLYASQILPEYLPILETEPRIIIEYKA